MAAIAVGSEAENRAGTFTYNVTIINKSVAADGTGTLTSIEIWADVALENCMVGTFYTTNGDTLKCRDSATLGTVASGSKQTITEDSGETALAISVVTGDYIGIYYTAGGIDRVLSGFLGVWYFSGQAIDPNDEEAYDMAAGDTLSLKGIGETTPEVITVGGNPANLLIAQGML